MEIIYKANEIILSGHAGYDDFGKDIVCSGVSAIVISSVNLLKRFDKESIKYTEAKNLVTIKVLKDDYITNTIIDNLRNRKRLSEVC